MVKVLLKGEEKDYEMLIVGKGFLYARREDKIELILETVEIKYIAIITEDD